MVHMKFLSHTLSLSLEIWGGFNRAYIVFMVSAHRRTHIHIDKWAERTGKLGISYEITHTERELQSSTWSANDIKVTSQHFCSRVEQNQRQRSNLASKLKR